tara:strand:- start:14 stop:505 length:492 start_codon:yes stop_codon:yes gene_type:complete
MNENVNTTPPLTAPTESPLILASERAGFQMQAKREQANPSAEYAFKGYSNFSVFCRINMPRLFLDTDSAAVDVIKNQIELFLAAQKNTIGGCGCNKNKRRDVALKVYKETAEMLSKGPPDWRQRIFNLLNNPAKVLFFEGANTGAPSRTDQEPLVELNNASLG